MTTLALAIAITSQSADPWTTADLLWREGGKTVVIELGANSAITRGVARSQDRAKRIEEIIKGMDAIAHMSAGSVAIECKWLSGGFRSLDSLPQQIKQIKVPSSGRILKERGLLNIRCLEGETLSLLDLQRLKLIDVSSIPEWFRLTRFVVRGEKIDGTSLAKDMLACLGGDMNVVDGRATISIDPSAFKRRRLRMANEQVKRFPPPFSARAVSDLEFDFVNAQLEIAILNKMNDQAVKALFGHPESRVFLSVERDPQTAKAVMAKFDLALRTLGSVRPKGLLTMEESNFSALLTGKGNPGGMVFLQSGEPFYF